MKKFLSFLSLILCGACLLSACSSGAGNGSSNGGNSSGGRGRYLQKDITPPGLEGLPIEALRDKDGKLAVYSQGLGQCFESTDNGESWEEKPGPGANNPELQLVDTLSRAEDGTLYGVKHAADGISSDEVVKILADGKLETVPVQGMAEQIAAGNSIRVDTLQCMPQERLLLHYYDLGNLREENTNEEGPGEKSEENFNAESDKEPDENPEEEANEEPDEIPGEEPGESSAFSMASQPVAGLYDLATGKLVGSQFEWSSSGVASDGEQAYLLGMDGSIQSYKLSDGSKTEHTYGKAPVSNLMFSLPAVASGLDGNLVVADPANFTSLNQQGESEEITNPGSFAFGNPNGQIQALFQTGKQEYILSYELEREGRLYKYAYDPDARLDPAKTLNIWSLRNSLLVRAAITEFMKQNPDALVNYNVALDDSETGDGAIHDAVNTLNTELLAGKGPDILLLDGLPAESYAAKNMLQDLSSLMDTSAVYGKLLSGLRQEDKLYMVPARFRVPLLVGDSNSLAEVDTLGKLADAVEAGPDNPGISIEAGDPFAALAEGEQPVLQVDFEELKQFLWASSANKILDGGKIDTEQLRTLLEAMKRISDKYGLLREQEGPAGAATIVTEGGNMLTGSPIAYMMDCAQYGALSLEAFVLYDAISKPSTGSIPFPGLSEGAWQPMGLAGINANAAYPEFAAGFLQTMLSEKIQSGLAPGIPVTEEGVQGQIKRLNETSKGNGGTGFTFDLQSLLESLGEPVLSDANVQAKVLAVADTYCSGELSLDDAIRQMEQDLKNYLAERK